MQIIRAYSERGQTPMNITHTILATVGSIIVMFAISKLLGNKQISQLTLFDYINGITIGSIASEMAVSQEMDELIVPVIAMVLYGLTGFSVVGAYDEVYPLPTFSFGQAYPAY